MKIHRWLDFKVTRRCNNYSTKCEYCDVDVTSPTDAEELPLATIHQTLLDARSVGFDVFCLLGGEPSIRDDAHELFDPLSDEAGIGITVVTNGKSANMPMYEALFRTKARRVCVQVSFDSFASGTPKRSEPATVLRTIMEAKESATRFTTSAHQCEVEVHCVISRFNHRNFMETIGFFAAKRVPVSLAMVCPWRVTDEPAKLNEFTQAEIEGICRRIDSISTGMPIDHFNRLVAQFARRLATSADRKVTRKCGAGLTHLVINGDGGVFKCMAESFSPSASLGNIRSARLHQILRKIDRPSACTIGSECFDGFAWDFLSLT